MLNAQESGSFIAKHSKNVTVCQSGVDNLALEVVESIKDGSIKETSWNANPFRQKSEEAANWCFFTNAINFSFWTDGEIHFTVTYDGIRQTGYFACCALINQALKAGLHLLDCSFYDSLSVESFSKIFTGDKNVIIPMAEQRYNCLKEVAGVLKQKYNGSFLNCLRLCNNSAQNLLRILVEDFGSFRDFANYRGTTVSFLKRAQILASDIYHCFDGDEPVRFSDIDSLTMFADYRVPQVLAYAGALQYSSELITILREHQFIRRGSDMEIEIRGCSIETVERIVSKVKQLLKNDGEIDSQFRVNAASVDYFLWCYRRSHAATIENSVPFHRTRTIYY